MTTLRTAAQQALEAMEWIEPSGLTGRGGIEARNKAITNLRAALAEPAQEPATLPGPGLVMCPACCAQFDPALNSVQPVQEPKPVAWMTVRLNVPIQTTARKDVADEWLKWGEVLPLYTAPQQRKPLSEDEKRALADKFLSCQPESYEVSGVFDLISAVERAHGIGGEE